ncbi:MAG: ribonuclease BN [Acidobacteria bacterium]|nr:MAG: ribonuclease BN [Acidobacteriota bacterium]
MENGFLRIFWRLLVHTYYEWDRDNASQLGAALAYYTIFSMAPILLVATAMAGIFLGRQAAEGRIVAEISGLIGQSSAQMIQTMVQNAWKPAQGIVATVIGVATLFLGATAAFVQMQTAFNIIWEKGPQSRPIWSLLKDRFLSFAMVLCTGFLLLATLVISAWLSALGKLFQTSFPITAQLMDALLSFIAIGILFALIYKILPPIEQRWREVWPAAVLCSALFSLGKFLIAFYIARSAFTSTFGAAASLAILLTWIYYSAQIFLFGAEFTEVYSRYKRTGTFERRT